MTFVNLKQDKSSKIKSELKSLFIVMIFAVLIRTVVFEIFFVPTSSMKATILPGDYIFSTKYSYGLSKYSFPFGPNIFSGRVFPVIPERGDVIIMKPPHDLNKMFIKRLIGLPGEKIEIINDLIYINDQPISREKQEVYYDENKKPYIKFQETLSSGVSYFTYKLLQHPAFVEQGGYDLSNFGPYFVPEGHFFFLGDNRDESGDSRYDLGFVPFEYLVAKARVVLFSTAEFWFDPNVGFIDQIARTWTWATSLRMDRMLVNFFTTNKQKPQNESDAPSS